MSGTGKSIETREKSSGHLEPGAGGRDDWEEEWVQELFGAQ